MSNEETKKQKAEVTQVTMTDGRVVGFAGKRKVLKETIIDESKIVIDGNVIHIEAGAIKIRFDLRDGSTKTFDLPLSLLPKFAGHGGEQKYGDELASPADKPLSEEDMMMALESLDSRIQKGDWRVEREGSGGVSGAGVVVKAIMEVTGKSAEEVKAFLQKKIDASNGPDGKPTLTRAALYKSFRAPGTKTAGIIERLEKEKETKPAAIDADSALGELAGS